jgi:hypothetical protein
MRITGQPTEYPPELEYYYLGMPVVITHLCNEKGHYPDPRSGWVNARWADGKVWTHWRAQLLDTPWGH